MSNDYPDIAKRKGAHQTLSFPNQKKLLTLKEEDYLQKHWLIWKRTQSITLYLKK